MTDLIRTSKITSKIAVVTSWIQRNDIINPDYFRYKLKLNGVGGGCKYEIYLLDLSLKSVSPVWDGMFFKIYGVSPGCLSNLSYSLII
jgi:hypothetical protein